METDENSTKLFNSDVVEELGGKEVNDRIASLPIFTCKKCSNLLKPPIILVQGIGNVCGECREAFAEKLQMSNEAMEMVLENLILLCKYNKNGCNERLKYSEIASHELGCKFGDFMCPLKVLEKCKWAQNVSLITDHFTKEHKTNTILKSDGHFQVRIDIAQKNEWIKLLYDYINLFVLHLYYDVDAFVLKCFLYHIKNEKEFLEDNYAVMYEDSCYIGNIRQFVKNEEFNSNFDTNEVLIIDLSQSPKQAVNIFIEIKDKSVTAIKEEGRLLKPFECPVCKYYMKPPIFQCVTGHSVCNICKIQLRNCPTCRELFGRTRNYSLEEISSKLHFPCMYQEQGCNVIKLGHEIVNHEEKCPFMLYKCPIFDDCAWEGLYDMMLDHVLIHDNSNTTKSNYYLGKIDTNLRKFTFYMVAYNRLFCASMTFNLRIHFYDSSSNSESQWVVQLIGPAYEAQLFKYEFGLIGRKPMDHEVKFTNICQEYCNTFTPYEGSFVIPDTVIQDFKINGKLAFYCKIIKRMDTDHKQLLRGWLSDDEH